MVLEVSIRDAQGMKRGNVVIRLESGARWEVEDDPSGVWASNVAGPRGRLERKDWGPLWLWEDQVHRVILHDVPHVKLAGSTQSGGGVLFEPKSTAFKDGKAAWRFSPGERELSANRVQARHFLREKLPMTFNWNKPQPIPYTPAGWRNEWVRRQPRKWQDNPFKALPPQSGSKETNCYQFPPWMVQSLGGSLPAGLKAAEDAAKRRNAWVAGGAEAVPRPGDIFTLCAGPTLDGTIVHIAVVYESSGRTWTVGQWGSGVRGYDGSLVEQQYENGRLWVDSQQKWKAIRGWVSLDKYLAR